MYALKDYDYDLPEELIAQQPLGQRADSRLLVLNRQSGEATHRQFHDLPELLRPSDLLVVNDTRVVPGRLIGRKPHGGRVEALILDYVQACSRSDDPHRLICQCLLKASKRPVQGTVLTFGPDLSGTVLDFAEGLFQVRFESREPFEEVLEKIGKVPLPPYIKRDDDQDGRADRFNYQTVYARQKGAVAAPTAGLHFTAPLLEKLKRKGIRIAPVTLHVSYGTFRPVRVDDIREHRMHSETYQICDATAEAINQTKAAGARVVGVGTTSVRTLEYAADATGRIAAGCGDCDLFIYPGFEFKIIDALITNFHLPQSTLLMLVSAFAGREKILTAYREAVAEAYRFFSYGDAMFIE